MKLEVGEVASPSPPPTKTRVDPRLEEAPPRPEVVTFLIGKEEPEEDKDD